MTTLPAMGEGTGSLLHVAPDSTRELVDDGGDVPPPPPTAPDDAGSSVEV